jgi:hypothetical protein
MSIRFTARRTAVLLPALVLFVNAGRLAAGMITLTAQISQSPSDGNLVLNNASLNDLVDGST